VLVLFRRPASRRARLLFRLACDATMARFTWGAADPRPPGRATRLRMPSGSFSREPPRPYVRLMRKAFLLPSPPSARWNTPGKQCGILRVSSRVRNSSRDRRGIDDLRPLGSALVYAQIDSSPFPRSQGGGGGGSRHGVRSGSAAAMTSSKRECRGNGSSAPSFFGFGLYAFKRGPLDSSGRCRQRAGYCFHRLANRKVGAIGQRVWVGVKANE